jgi:hypothetical protein
MTRNTTRNTAPTLGWMIEVSERRLGGNPCTHRYYVAVVDENEALRAVRNDSETENPTVRARRKITDPNVLRLLNLNPGTLLRLG